MTPWRERRLPTAWVSSVSLMTVTWATSTAGGLADAAALGGPLAARSATALTAEWDLFWYHQAAPEAPTMPITASIG